VRNVQSSLVKGEKSLRFRKFITENICSQIEELTRTVGIFFAKVSLAFKLSGTFQKYNPLYESIIQSDMIFQYIYHCLNNHGKLINANAKKKDFGIFEFSTLVKSRHFKEK
jgi:hypothetical protein